MEKETLETQMKPHLYFILPISLSLTFPLFPFSPPLPLDLAGARAQAQQRRPARRRPDGGRSGRMLVSGFPFFSHPSNFIYF